MNREKMILVTHGFPFGESERSFLSEEIKLIAEAYDLTVMPILDNTADRSLRYKTLSQFRVVPFTFDRKKEIMSTPRTLTDKAAVKEILSMLPDQKRAKKVSGFVNRSCVLGYALENIIRTNGADIIYTYWCAEETYAAIRQKRKYHDLKVISRLHGYDLFKERNPLGIQPMHKYIADNADLLVFVSDFGRNYFKETFPGKAKTIVSYLGAKGFEKLSSERENSFVVVSCSSVIPLKRVEMIAQALKFIKSPALHWIHIGDGSEIENVRLAANGIKCEFLGQIPNDKIAEIYKQYSPDLFITASSSEGLPISIVEAFSCGIPAIATAAGGIPELVKDGDTGFIVPVDTDARRLAQTIEKYYSLDTAQRHKMRENAFEMYRDHFDARDNARRFISILKKLKNNK